eukprot:5307391-Amphidinium_carterae.1
MRSSWDQRLEPKQSGQWKSTSKEGIMRASLSEARTVGSAGRFAASLCCSASGEGPLSIGWTGTDNAP